MYIFTTSLQKQSLFKLLTIFELHWPTKYYKHYIFELLTLYEFDDLPLQFALVWFQVPSLVQIKVDDPAASMM